MPEVLHPVVVQVLPVAVFLLAMTVTAEIAQLAGVFDVAAHAMARRARHRVVLLWLLFALLAVVSTIVMSLDTTAVHRFEDLGAGHGDYVRTAALPAVTAIVATLVLVAVHQRRALRGTYAVDPPPRRTTAPCWSSPPQSRWRSGRSSPSGWSRRSWRSRRPRCSSSP